VRQWLRFGIGLVTALVLHSILDRLAPQSLAIIDPYLVLVVYFGTAGQLGGAIIAGVVAGFAQDALSGAILGVHAFSLTLTGYLVAWLNSRLVLKGTLAFGACVFAATIFNEVIIALLVALLVAQPLDLLPPGLLWKTVGTTILGMIAWRTVGGMRREQEELASARWEGR